MFDQALREAKDYLLTPIARQLQTLNPTTITLIAFAIGLIGAWLVTQQQYLWGLICWLSNRLLDGFDGTLARVNQRQSDLGGYVDILLDFVVYALIPIAVVISQPSEINYLSLALLLGAFYINSASWMYLSGILEKRRQETANTNELTTINMPVGLIGGTETVIFYCIFIMLPPYLLYTFSVMTVLVLITVVQRVAWAKRHISY